MKKTLCALALLVFTLPSLVLAQSGQRTALVGYRYNGGSRYSQEDGSIRVVAADEFEAQDKVRQLFRDGKVNTAYGFPFDYRDISDIWFIRWVSAAETEARRDAARNEEARKAALAEVMRQEPASNTANQRGVSLGRQGDFDGAIAAFTEAIQIAASPRNLTNRGNMYYRQGNYQQAFADFQRAIQLDENYGFGDAKNGFFDARGRMLIDQKDYAGAIAVFTEAIEIDYVPESTFYSGRGKAYLLNGNYAEARADFMEAINRDKNNNEARQGLVDLNAMGR